MVRRSRRRGARTAQRMLRRAQNEASSLAEAFLTEPGKQFRVTYDNRCSPPTYGDLFNVLMLTRFLALNGVEVEFVLLDDGYRRSDWSALEQEGQDELVAEQVSLAQVLLPSTVRFTKARRNSDFTEAGKDSDVFEVLAQFAASVTPYKLAPSLLDALYRDSRFEQRSSFLLEDVEHAPQQSQTSGNSNPYVAWHIRKGLWSRDRDSSRASILQDFRELREIYPGHSLMIFSSTPGIEFALTVLEETGAAEEMSRLGLYLGGQLVPGFINAIPLVLQSDFYFQRLGGGIGMVPIFSNVPYLILAGEGNYFYGRRGNRLVPWARRDQTFVINPRTAVSAPIRSCTVGL